MNRQQIQELMAENAKLKATEAKLKATEAKLEAKEAEIAELKAKEAENEELKATERSQLNGTYWNTILDIWSSKEEDFAGHYENGLGCREKNNVDIYNRFFLPEMTERFTFLVEEEGGNVGANLTSITRSNNDVSQVHGLLDLLAEDGCLGSTITRSVKLAQEFTPCGQQGNRRREQAAKKKVLKDFMGRTIKENNEASQAHCFPKDMECLLFWWPIFQVVTGIGRTQYNKEVLKAMSKLQINLIVFPTSHNHIFDVADEGCVCTIPIFDSQNAMASWKSKTPYKMLIVCDSSETYAKIITKNFHEASHIGAPTLEDVRNATKILAETTKLLADSLVSNWDGFYMGTEDGERKKMLEKMKGRLLGSEDNQGTVRVPVLNLQDESEVKLFTVDYGALYDSDEGRAFIQDPFPVAIKAAINLSGIFYEKECKLLTACSGSFDDGSEGESTYMINKMFERFLLEKQTTVDVVGCDVVLHTVSDDESAESSLSDLSGDSD